MEKIRFVCATRETHAHFSTQTMLGRTLQVFERLPMLELQLFAENSRGLAAVYNEAIEQSKDRPAILVFVHDDVHLTDFYMAGQLDLALRHFDVAGVAGNVRRVPRQPSWYFSSREPGRKGVRDEAQYLSGAVGGGSNFPDCHLNLYGPTARPCKLLDGLLLAVRSETLHRTGLRFDPRFEFHFYDLDFCRQAELLGLRMGTWPLSVIHASAGNFNSPAWADGYRHYLEKYGE